MIDSQEQQMIEFIRNAGESSSKEVFDGMGSVVSYATVKRKLSRLISANYIAAKGKGKATRYIISPVFELIQPIDPDEYFKNEIDEREIREGFNFDIIKGVLAKHSVFTDSELKKLRVLQKSYQDNISQLSENEYRKELERLAIDLSWKSSQIEGNTYSLLETERLLRERETAAGKTKEEAIMLLNHKDAIDFIADNPDFISPLSISVIEDIHSLLVKELGVERNIRKRRVGISGTNYRPLDNQFQISEALHSACNLINSKENEFEKALLALTLISYIQPFVDGNKRTARIVSNAILMHHNCCPLSFRTVDPIEYKKGMLLFYEQNNISGMKDIFINQFEFAVNTYF